jgi:beta-galactosidase
MNTMIIPFNRDWLFHDGDIIPRTTSSGFTKAGNHRANGADEDLDDSAWQKVHLPHDCVIGKGFCRSTERFDTRADIPEMDTLDSLHTSRGSVYVGAFWYRKHFKLPENAKNKRIYLRFDGIYRDSTVYINQYLCKRNLSGYLGFTVDVTDLVRHDGGENILAVRADSTETEGWWYQGGGIYRNVYLIIAEQVHIAEDTLFARSDVNVGEKTAALDLSLTAVNHTEHDVSQKVTFTLLSHDGKPIGETKSEVTIPAMGQADCRGALNVKDITLWDCDNPYLYTLRASLENGADASVEIGFRTIRFDKDKGFFLNGVPTKLRGACVHQGHAGIGVAEFDGIHEFKLKKLKELGFNAYRTSHNPVSPALLSACDRLGVLVMEETRLLSTGEEDKDQLCRMILRDRCHPSVILWSIGNEELRQFSEFASPIASTMRRIAHSIDPTRPVTEAMLLWDREQKRVRDDVEITAPISENVDVLGLNYGLIVWDKLHKTFPEKAFVCSEIRSIGATRGMVFDDREHCHLTPFAEGLLPTIESGTTAWKMTDEREYASGMFIWTGFDYYGEPTPFNFPAVASQFGAMDLCGFEKYGCHYYKQKWRPELKTFALCPHWNPEAGGETRHVYLFGECEEAELFLNGRSLGKKPYDKYVPFIWENVPFETGEITAVGYVDGKQVASDTVKTTGDAKVAVATVDHLSEDENGFTYAVIHLYTKDENGNVVPTANNVFQIETGDGVTLLGSGNGDPSCTDKGNSETKALFYGHAQVIVRRDSAQKCGKVTFTAKDIGTTELTF